MSRAANCNGAGVAAEVVIGRREVRHVSRVARMPEGGGQVSSTKRFHAMATSGIWFAAVSRRLVNAGPLLKRGMAEERLLTRRKSTAGAGSGGEPRCPAALARGHEPLAAPSGINLAVSGRPNEGVSTDDVRERRNRHGLLQMRGRHRMPQVECSQPGANP